MRRPRGDWSVSAKASDEDLLANALFEIVSSPVGDLGAYGFLSIAESLYVKTPLLMIISTLRKEVCDA
jgi:hypothetical protein